MLREITGAAAGAWLIAVPLVLGCAADAPRTIGHVVRDSAGVEIVESAAPAWSEGEGWRLSDAPILDIGTREGEAPYLLDGVMGVVRLDDGGIVVANMGDNTLRFYDAAGRHIRSVGRSGRGPGEFVQILKLERQGEELHVGQFFVHPIQVFDLAGAHVRSVVPEAGRTGLSLVGTLGDGSHIMVSWPQGTAVQTGGSWVEDAIVYHVPGAGGAADSLLSRPGVAYSQVLGRFGNPIVFGPIVVLEVSDDRIIYSFRERYEIEEYDVDGTLQRIIRRAWTPEPVTEAQIARYKDELINLEAEGGGAPPARLVEQRRRIADESSYATHHPPFDELLADREANLWAERTDPDRTEHGGSLNPTYDSPSRWDVFDARGVWLGEVEMPPRFRPYEIGPDYVAGVWRDDVDVEHARVYALHKS